MFKLIMLRIFYAAVKLLNTIICDISSKLSQIEVHLKITIDILSKGKDSTTAKK